MLTCLNCEADLTGTFCQHCGQRASTRRFSVRTLWDTDFLEQNFSLTRGLPSTLLVLLYRPGKLAAEYISGKRKRYFPFIGLFLLLTALDAVVRSYADISVQDILGQRYGIHLSSIDEAAVSHSFNTYFRLFALITVPVLALFHWLLLGGLRWNYWEHCVAVVLLLCTRLWASLLVTSLALLPLSAAAERSVLSASGLVAYVVACIFFYQLTPNRRWWSSGWRAGLLVLLFFLVYSAVIVLGLYTFGTVSDGTGNVFIRIG